MNDATKMGWRLEQSRILAQCLQNVLAFLLLCSKLNNILDKLALQRGKLLTLRLSIDGRTEVNFAIRTSSSSHYFDSDTASA